MPEKKIKVNAWIPADMYDKVIEYGYTSQTVAITKGLELLIKLHSGYITDTSDTSMDTSGYTQETPLSPKPPDTLDTSGYNFGDIQRPLETFLDIQARIYKEEIENLKEALRLAPSPVEMAEIKALHSSQKAILEEKERTIQILTKDLENYSLVASAVRMLPAGEPKKKSWWKLW